MRTSIWVFLILLFALVLGCSDNSSVSGQRGVLQLFLTDQPIQAKEIDVTLSEIEVHETGGNWKPFVQASKTLDLLTLKGTQSLLAMAELPDGTYTGFRLRVEEGHIIDDQGNRCNLTVPSDKIEVPVVFEIQKGALTKVVLDFKAEDSVHVIQAGKTERCILRPVLTPVSVTNQ